MGPLAIRLVVLLAIFASTFLLSQLLLAVLWRRREKTAAINRRLELVRAGTSPDQVMAALRKNAPAEPMPGGGLLAAPWRAFRTTLFAAAVP